MSMERPLTDMKNLFLNIKFFNQYATVVVLLPDRATHTHKLTSPGHRRISREETPDVMMHGVYLLANISPRTV